MLKILTISLMGVLLQFWGEKPKQLEPLELLLWENSTIFEIPNQPDPHIQELTNEYLQLLTNRGFPADKQGIWFQSTWVDFSNYQGNIPVSAASLTKIVTSMASLKTWELNHHFDTLIYHTGIIENGSLNGDLIIQGGGNPLYVWEEAIALGNGLNQIGIFEVKGDLLIMDNFRMNFQKTPERSGEFFLKGINQKLWTKEVTKLYEVLPPKTPRPEVTIKGNLKVIENLPIESKLLIKQESLSLKEILRQMNLYSNNYMAQMLADQIGSPEKLIQLTQEISPITPEEIELINGSGLGGENMMSPHLACQMMLDLDNYLAKINLSIEDLFPMAGKDILGTAENRNIPSGITFKTGTLPSIKVSALAGIIPTKKYGNVCFAILNTGINYLDARVQQDRFLNQISAHWEIIPFSRENNPQSKEKLGDSARVISVISNQ
jgi:serine-type D-Ala-D-Ala carboxypeptidase/endopeptidase (penicillin-binding protein 4)